MNNLPKHNKMSKYSQDRYAATYNISSKSDDTAYETIEYYTNDSYYYGDFKMHRYYGYNQKFSESICMAGDSLSNMMNRREELGFTKFSTAVVSYLNDNEDSDEINPSLEYVIKRDIIRK